MTDGKYCTLTQLKQYIGGFQTVDADDPYMYNGLVEGSPDDQLLSQSILNAEMAFEHTCGAAFDRQTFTHVQATLCFVDYTGILHLFARERGPVTNVAAVQYRYLYPSVGAWKDLTFDATDGVVYPSYQSTDTGPWPDAWHVQIIPTSGLYPTATGQVLCRWTYTGGFSPIPSALTFLIAKFAAYLYKVREAPVYRTVNINMGTVDVPASIPKEIRDQFELWKAVYA